MKPDDLVAVAENQSFLVTRAQAIGTGLSSSTIQRRVDEGLWLRREAGVYQIDLRPQLWLDRVRVAVLAGGGESLASHRSALKLWELDGPTTVPVEITVTYGHGPIPAGVIVHRTRRLRDLDEAQGVPTTSVKRTLLDCAAILPEIVLTKALDSAIRRRRVGINEMFDFVSQRGGRGVKGTRKLRSVVSAYDSDSVPSSPSESEAYFHIRNSSLPRPVLQVRFATRNGTRRPDFYWPAKNKAVEVDGIGTHSSADALDDDLQRQNDLLELGIELRRFSARQVRRNPAKFVEDLRRFLNS